jgi:hypothetical protein
MDRTDEEYEELSDLEEEEEDEDNEVWRLSTEHKAMQNTGSVFNIRRGSYLLVHRLPRYF